MFADIINKKKGFYKMKDRVTIIVPIYNVEKYIDKCLNSLINQTYKNIEILAIIDGSPDNSVQKVKKFCEQDKRVCCIEKENGGYGSVLEYGIKNGTGDYILICDPDDWLENNAVETLYNMVAKYNLDLIVADKHIVYSNGKYDYINLKSNVIELYPNKIYEGMEIQKFSFLLPSPHAKLYKRELLKNITFPHKVSYTDFLLYELSLKSAKKAMYIEDKLAYYLFEREGNTFTDTSSKAINDHVVVWNSILNNINEEDSYILLRLFYEMKGILSGYCKSTTCEYNNDINNSIIDMCIKLKKYKKSLKNFNFSIKLKLERVILFGNSLILKNYIKIRKKVLKR